MPMNSDWSKYILGIVAGISISLVIGAVVTYGKLMGLEATVAANQARMDAMEQGLTTPMSVVTRERFNATDERLSNIENRLERLVDQFHAAQGVTRQKKRDGADAGVITGDTGG